MEDTTLAKFACALRGARVKDLGNGMQLLSFGPGPYFPDDVDQRRTDLLVCDFYGTLFKRTATMRASLLTGAPGTGKSWWIWYAVHQLLNQNPSPAIVWQTFKRGINKCVLFKGGKVFVGHLDAFSLELDDDSTW